MYLSIAHSPLPHTLLNPEDGIEICVISKDPTDELKEKLLSTPVAGITKVLAVGKLKKNYHEFGKRRELVNRYDAFFCDDRVVTMMPKLCGKVFFDRKKLPVPVRVTGSAAVVAKEITKARDSTYMIVGAGQTIAVRIGKNNMTPQQITDNVYAVLSTAIDNIPKKWKAVGSLYLQATGTVALPLYKVLPSLTVATDEDDEDDDNNDEDNEKYRYLNENLDDEEDDEEEVEEEEKEEKTTKKSSTGNTGSAVEVGKKRTRPTETTTTTSVPTSTKSTVIATNKSAKATASVSTEKATTVSSNKTESTKSTTTATSAKKSRTLEPPASKSKSSNTNTQVGIKGNK